VGRISRGWQLTKMSLRVVRKDKEILVFPFLSSVITMAIIGSFFLGMIVTTPPGEDTVLDDPWLFGAFFAFFYFVAYFVGVFFNVAVIGCATIRMDGGNPTVRDGLRIAFENLRYIFMWALFAATIGMLLRALQQRAGLVGKILFGGLGAAFTIASYFAVPVFVYEKVGPLTALKRSLSVLRKAWGEAIVGNLGLGVIFFLLALLGLLPILIGIAIMSLTAVFVGIAVAVIYWVVLGLVFSAAQSVLVAALYRYATTGKISEEFAGVSFGNPFT